MSDGPGTPLGFHAVESDQLPPAGFFQTYVVACVVAAANPSRTEKRKSSAECVLHSTCSLFLPNIRKHGSGPVDRLRNGGPGGNHNRRGRRASPRLFLSALSLNPSGAALAGFLPENPANYQSL